MGRVDDVVILMKNLVHQLLEVWVDLNEVHFVLFEEQRYMCMVYLYKLLVGQ